MKFVLVSQPRCGTHMLATSLESHDDISIDYEIFNADSSPWIVNQKPLDIINKTFKSKNGFILHLTQSKEAQSELAKMDDVKFICLYRLNHLERYVSVMQANMHNKWQVYDGQEKPPQNKIKVDPIKLKKDIDIYLSLWAEFRAKISFKPTLVVEYGELTTNYSMVTGKIFKFLNVKPMQVKPKTIKIGCDIRELVTNYDEVANIS